jgi:tRNA modification GTPase
MTLIFTDTICALATPPGIGGIAVLRMSGPQAWEIAKRLSAPLLSPRRRGETELSPRSRGDTRGVASARKDVPWAMIPHANWERARRMRKRPTEAERRLWRALRERQLPVDFRRQHPIGPFIADFYSSDGHLVVEVDGDTHGDPNQRVLDAEREKYFRWHGLRVKRYTDRDVLGNPDAVVADIAAALPPFCPPVNGGKLEELANTARFARIMSDGELIDEVVLVFFQGPRSYTGEDVVEISCHGGRYAAARILELLLRSGARLARPGEFTERAFLNGKLDLAQAEAVAELIHARTQRAGRAAARQLSGGLSERVRAMRARLLDLLALLELELDFSEEDVEFQKQAERLEVLRRLQKDAEGLAATFQMGRLVREGLRVALAGAPNAGKSTLLNALAREDRAIVSPEPGTTRDVVEAHIEVEGIEVILQDTAGLRPATGEIESEGIIRTRRAVERADLVLLLVDRNDPHWPEAETLAQISSKPTVLVWNKMDLPESAAARQPTGVRFDEVVCVSALTGEGVEALLHHILQVLVAEETVSEDIVVSEARHHDALLRVVESLHRAEEQIAEPTLSASDLRDAVNALGEEILERIFSKFCIGK